MTVGPPPQSVTKASPGFLFFSHIELIESILRLVQGHITHSVPIPSTQEGAIVHGDDVVQGSRHSILTIRGTLVSAGTCLNAISSMMLRVLAL